eukprot:m.847422 g.847422  ORF g.847422 m.847422 type:complete len:637 (+) comp23484_c0_seq7:100-2010(+)
MSTVLCTFARRQWPTIARQLRVQQRSAGCKGRQANVTPEVVAALGQCSTQALVDALWVNGWPSNYVEGARPLAPNTRMAGQAVTLRFVRHRPDIAADKPNGVLSPEYVAFEMCGPENVLVMSACGPWESVGGDIKFLRLKQRNVGGLVTDGSVRDTNAVSAYGFPVYSHSTTAKQGPATMQPWAVNDVVNVGGTVVRPGDVIVGDSDGVVVVPQSFAVEALRVAQEREEVEDAIKEELEANPTCPGVYYPFKPPVARESPLGVLLERRGITHQFAPTRALSTRASLVPGCSSRQRRQLSTTATAKGVPDEMKAVRVHTVGDVSALTVETTGVPSDLRDGDVLVRNAHAGVNFIDTYHRSGLYARELPFIVGQEASGEVVKTTPEALAAGFGVGARVCYSVLETYCEYSKVSAGALLAVPDNVNLATACTVPVQGLTAHYLVHDAHAGIAQPGDWMLVHAAAGGTGQFVVQLATAAGYRVIGTCSESKMALAQSLGCEHVIDYRSENVADRVMEITGGAGVKAVLDGVGQSTYEGSLASLAVRGICVFFGNASGPVPPISPLKLVPKSNFITRPKLNDYTRTRTELVARAEHVMSAVGNGDVSVAIDKRFSIDDVVAAHTYIEAGKTTGKIIIDIAP